MRASVTALATLVLALGCASARPRPDDVRALAAADARVRDGCYDCLQQARATYARLAVGRDAARVVARLFETELLLALRERELALDATATLARARALAPRLPAALAPERLLAIVDAVPPDAAGMGAAARETFMRAHASFPRTAAGEVAWLAQAPLTPVVRDYLALAVECTYGRRSPRPGEPPRPPLQPRTLDPSAPPLLDYRTGTCGLVDGRRLQRARDAVPAFAEAAYFHAQLASEDAAETGGDEARALLDVAYARFPNASGVTFLFGQLELVVGDCDAAVRHFDETLAAAPTHEGAMLARTICLTNLRRDSAAIASATQLIALGSTHTAQAYYWRALNRERRRELPLARSDIEEAKRRATSDNVLTLAGVIETEQGELPIAERDLRTALASPRGPDNCTAASYLGRVLAESARPPLAAATYESAMQCLDRKVADRRARIAALGSAPSAHPAFTARRVAALEADLAELLGRYYTSAFNAASTHARSGDVARAVTLLDVAAQDPRNGEMVGKLRAALAARRGGGAPR